MKRRTKPRYIYALYENGKEVFRGTYNDICENIGEINNSLGWYETRGCKLFGKYEVKKVGKNTDTGERLPRIFPDAKKLDTLDYLLMHLNQYGNTILNSNRSEQDVIKYIRQLKRKGINCTYRLAVDRLPARRVRNPKRRRAEERFWVIERV